VVEPRLLPVRFQVTGLAAGAKSAAMNVVPGVTTVTRGRWFLLVQRIGVAGVALDTAVGVAQCEFRVAIMIEDRLFPARFRVALLAVWTQSPFVNVVFTMASDAGCREFLCVQRRLVAGDALCGAMRFTQCEVRVALMVEPHRFPF